MVGRGANWPDSTTGSQKSGQGRRLVIFVLGEPRVGKTTLTRVPSFSCKQSCSPYRRGRCAEHYGAGEPYVPILEAMTRLCREPRGEKLVDILHRLATAGEAT